MFKVSELLKAAKGRLLNGNSSAVVKGISIDSRTVKPQEAFIAIKGRNYDGSNFIGEAIRKGAKAVIACGRDPIIGSFKKIPFIVVGDTTKALGDIAGYHRRNFDIPVIAVTGSNGKTTTKEMIARVLSGQFKVLKNSGTENNQIGLPLTLLNLDSSHKLAVLEIGTNHFGEVDYLAKICRPNIGVITNIGPAHLEYFTSLKGVLEEKNALLKHLESPRVAVLNADDNLLRKQVLSKSGKPVVLGFGIKRRADFSATGIKASGGRVNFLVNRKYKFTLKTPGTHNIYNALAALTVGRLFGMEYKDISSKLSAFDFPRNRLEFLKLNNTVFINDAYNSNPASLGLAIEALGCFQVKGRKIIVMGDMLELGSRGRLFHRQAGRQAARICDVFITVGELSKFAAEVASISGLGAKNVFACASNLEAQDILFRKVSPGPDDVVLIKGSRSMRMEDILRR
ncbi:MAG: UDP-N-acetylmuramoyl-tripeptide--D-alanyl-D-alanine ligase [Candidatus Omnitrophota bacterium]